MTKKGLAYILDAFLAMTIVLLLFIVITKINSERKDTFLAGMHMTRAGSDITYVITEDGTLDSLASATIKARIEQLLPPQYNMRLKIIGDFPPGIMVIETNTSAIENKFIATGKRVAAINSGQIYFAELHYEVWGK